MPGPPLPERSGIRKGENGISACAPRERTRDRSGENEPWQSVVAAVRRGSYNHPVRLVCFGDIHMAIQAIERLGPELREADWAILTGDLTHFGDPPDAFRVVDAVRRFCPSVLAVTGNLDMPQVIDAFRAQGISLHGEGRQLGDLGIFGCGGSNITPMDTPTAFEEHELRAVLEPGHAAVADAPRRLMICHTPPFHTQLDRLLNGPPAGSPAPRPLLEARRAHLPRAG